MAASVNRTVLKDHNHHATLIFTHIPKAAGTTLSAVLRERLGPRCVLNIAQHPAEQEVQAFSTLSEKERGATDMVIGHFPFGLHRLIPRECVYLSILRDPVSRVVSLYHNVRGDPAHYAHSEGFSMSMSLLDFVESGVMRDEVGDGQLWYFRDYQAPCDTPGKERLEEAKAIMRNHYLAVGVVERFDESLMLFQSQLGWNGLPLYYPRHVFNLTRSYDLTERERDAILARNEWDCELYRYVVDRLDERIAGMGRAFRTRTAWFRRINRTYGTYREIQTRIAETVRRGRSVWSG